MSHNNANCSPEPRNRVDEKSFDHLILGTGLTESILARLLLDSSTTTVLQVDPQPRYGQSWAAFTLDQLQTIKLSHSNQKTRKRVEKLSRYALSLQPALVPARGKFVDRMISSNVAPYLSFQLLADFILSRPDGDLLTLPGSKHDLFRLKSLSLVDKRLLMRFFQFILDTERSISPQAGQSLADFLTLPPFSISSPHLLSLIVTLSLSPTADPPATAVINRLTTIFRSVGRHASPSGSALPAAFLLGEYGGGGEWVEGFVRASAVTGRAVQVLGRPIITIERTPDHRCWNLKLGPQIDQPQMSEELLEFTATHLLVSEEYLALLKPDLPPSRPLYHILRGIIIIGPPGLRFDNQASSPEARPSHTLMVFPAEGGCRHPVQALIVGAQAHACPADQQVIYLSTTTLENPAPDPTTTLNPYLERMISKNSTTTSLEELVYYQRFYTQTIAQPAGADFLPPDITRLPSWPEDVENSTLFDLTEWATETSESIYANLK